MNRLTIIGNLTADPVLKTTSSDRNVCNFTVAVNKGSRAKGNQTAEFFRVAVWDVIGENCAKYLHKGNKVAVNGTVQLDEFTANGEKRACLMVHASEVEFLQGREENAVKPAYNANNTTSAPVSEGWMEVTGEELPF